MRSPLAQLLLRWLVLALGVMDNLVKGASGQAIQNANLLLGIPETTGLPVTGLMP